MKRAPFLNSNMIDFYDRISWYYSEEYSYRKKHRKHG
nr:MAG TPA: hypothetical protein [Caudoviricetes sp.]